VVESGELEVLVQQKADDDKNGRNETIKVAEIRAGQTVGEAALMYNTRRNATLKASQETRVWVMEATQFHKIRSLIKDLTKKKVRKQQKFLSSVQLFSGMKPHELTNLTQACHEVRFKPGETIIPSSSDTDNDMYIILEGKAWVERDESDISICRKKEIGIGDYFMQRFSEDRLSAVIASCDTLCLRINKDDFDFLVSPYMSKCNEGCPEDSQSESISDTDREEELPKDFVNRVPYNLEDFTSIAVAGIGSFGRVDLVRVGEGTNKKVFALKQVEKNKAINKHQIEHMKNERRVMFMMDSPFIVKLFATYKNSTCVYFLLEKVLGGELFYLLRNLHCFNEHMSRFYCGCVVLALEHIHSHRIIYRDLKPENILITRNGYLKMTDFGFAKKRNQSTSLCGTPEYLAPEMITGGIQNFGVDWWCLGIFLFEMLVGRVPFCDSENRKQYEDILTSRPRLPNSLTWESQELIHKLLQKNAFRRLGSSPNGAGDIKEQSWFRKKFTQDVEQFDWKKLSACMLEAPYKPKLTSEEDTRHLRTPNRQQVDERTELSREFDPSLFKWCEEF